MAQTKINGRVSAQGDADRGTVRVTAAADRVKGVPVIEQGWMGFPKTAAAAGAVYSLDCEAGAEFEIDFIASSTLGDLITIATANNALARVAKGAGAAPASGTRLLGHVSAVPGAGATGTFGDAPMTGRMWIRLAPQSSPTT